MHRKWVREATADLDPPGFCLFGHLRLDHTQGLGQATAKSTDVIPDPVRLQLLPTKVHSAVPVIKAHLHIYQNERIL